MVLGRPVGADAKPNVDYSKSSLKGEMSAPSPTCSGIVYSATGTSFASAGTVSKRDLIRNCPTATVELDGIPVNCLLDTGAETSLLSYDFYLKHFHGSTSLESPESFIHVYGASGTEIPIVGVWRAPLKVFGQTITVSLLVKRDDMNSLDSIRDLTLPLLLGCNVLHQVMSLKPGDAKEEWKFVFDVLLSCPSPVGEAMQKGCEPDGQSVSPVVSGPTWKVLPPCTARVMECHVDKRVFSGDLAYLESQSTGEGVRVVDGCQSIVDGATKLLVANTRKDPAVIPLWTRLASASEMLVKDQAQVNVQGDSLQVLVGEVLCESPSASFEALSQEPPGEPESVLRPEPPSEPECNSCEYINGQIVLPDGSLYTLPPGLKLDGVSPEHLLGVVELIERRREAFSQGPFDLGKCNLIPHEIRLTDTRPVNLPHRRIAPYLIQEVRDQIQGLVDKGIVRKSSSDYASPIVPVRKKDGGLRLCIDYCKLNQRTAKDAFPLPRIEETLEALGRAKLFSSLDLAHGYFQLLVHPNSVPLTAFRVPWGLFEFTRLPQGLCTSPNTFQRVMEYILGDLNMQQLILYLDDVLVFSATQEDHLSRLDEVLGRLIASGLKLNGKKCRLFQRSLSYLGHIVSDKGVSMDPAKVERIQDWPVPANSGELASFLGLASYYRRFIPGFSMIAAPLHALKSVGTVPVTIMWTTEAAAFDQLKQALTESPVLVYPDYSKDFYLEIDASFRGLGACLSQQDCKGHLHPISYASRGLRGSERRYPDYSSFKLELLGLKWAVADKFGDHLLGHHCIVLTDNNPLAHLATANLGATEQRWVAKLAPYDLDIRYRMGRSNRVADGLSRNPLNDLDVHISTLVCEGTLSSPTPIELRAAESVVDRLPETHSPSVSGILPAYSVEQLALLQQQDEILSRIFNRKQMGWLPGQEEPDREVQGLRGWLIEYDHFVIRKGLLYRQIDDSALGRLNQLLVPELLKQTLLESVHDGWGHQGIGRTYGLLKTRCYWPGMYNHAKTYVKNCVKCTLAKTPTPKVRPPLRHLLAFRPLELVALDFVKVDRGKGGMEDILTITDGFTKWAQAIPCQNQLAVTVAKKLRDHWFTIFGIPTRLHSDQGQNFESALIKELCTLYGIRKSRTTIYHPQGNGQTERFNKTLCGLIKSLDHAQRKNWPEWLPHVVFIYNSTPHRVTGLAPYTMMYGREPKIPLDHLLGNLQNDWDEDFVSQQASMMDKVWKVAQQRNEQALDKDKARHDKRVRGQSLEIGDYVFKQKTGFRDRHKLEDNFCSEQFVVTDRNLDQNLYQIRPALGGKVQWINRKMLIKDPRGALDASNRPDDQFNVIPLVEDDSDDPLSDEDNFLFTFTYTPEEYDAPVVVPEGTLDQPDHDEGVAQPSDKLRRSTRTNKGQHSNPYKIPRSATE